MTTIPAADIVTVTPNVLAAGGDALDLIGLFVSNNIRVPIGTVSSFANASDVGNFFGFGSDEYKAAVIYFSGFDNSNVKPGSLLITQFPNHGVAAYLRSGEVTSSVATLAALTGSLNIVVDGFAFTSTNPAWSGATTYSNIATILTTALQASAPTSCAFTGSLAPVSGHGDNSLLTVSAVSSGTLHVGMKIAGTTVATYSIITALGTGTGTTGTYYVAGANQTVGSESMTAATVGPTVTYDSISGAFFVTSPSIGSGSTIAFATGSLKDNLFMTVGTGAVLSQGSQSMNPGPFMDEVVQLTQDWATFMTVWDPDSPIAPDPNTYRKQFSDWANGENNRYAYVAWDGDLVPSEGAAPDSFGAYLQTTNNSGTFLTWAPDNTKAAFVCGATASIDFSETNGRITYKFRSQTGLTPDVTDQTTKDNLDSNGYNFYGAWATANQTFQFLAEGTVSGPFTWMDSYVNQIWLNNQLQLSLMILMTNMKSIPYNNDGYALIEAACNDPITAAVNFGAIRAGVTLSALQIAEVNSAAGVPIDTVLNQRGWYLQVLDATPQVRQARGTPPCTLWYMDGESIQKIDLASVDLL